MKLRVLALLALVAAVPTAGYAQTLMEQLVGAFNNNEQVWQQDLDKVKNPYPRQHWRWQKVDEATLSLAIAEGQSAAEPQWLFTQGSNSLGTFTSVARANGEKTSCVYLWRKLGAGYVGEVQARKQCPAELPDRWTVSDAYLISSYPGKRKSMDYQARRVQAYTGWIGLKRNVIDESAGEDEQIFLQGINFHDEGYVAQVLDDGKPTGYAIELARLTYQQTQLAILKLGVIDESTGKTVAYTWAHPGSERIGINLRWIQSGLTIAQD